MAVPPRSSTTSMDELFANSGPNSCRVKMKSRDTFIESPYCFGAWLFVDYCICSKKGIEEKHKGAKPL